MVSAWLCAVQKGQTAADVAQQAGHKDLLNLLQGPSSTYQQGLNQGINTQVRL